MKPNAASGKFKFSQHAVCNCAEEIHVSHLVGKVEVTIYVAPYRKRWTSGFYMKVPGRELLRPCAIGYQDYSSKREAIYNAFKGAIDVLEYFLDLLWDFEWQFGEYDDDPAPVLEEMFLQNIQKLKIHQGYYDEDVIF